MISLIKRKGMETSNISQEGRIYDYIVRKKIVRKSLLITSIFSENS